MAIDQSIRSGTLANSDIVAQTLMFQTMGVRPHKRYGYTVYVIQMPAPLSISEAYFAAIVHKDNEPRVHREKSASTRYFILEKTFSPRPMLCERCQDGSHQNFGLARNSDMTAFVEAVFARIAMGK